MNKIPTYQAILEYPEDGITTISWVTNPATQVDMLCFNEEDKNKYRFADEEKHMVTSVVMLADTKIYRYNDGFEYYITYSPETLQQMCEKMLLEGTFNICSFEHDGKVLDPGLINLVELYTVDETKKSPFNVPKGSIIAVYKVNDDEIWELFKSGEIGGISLEGYFNIKEITNPEDEYKNTKNKFMTILEQLKNLILEYEDTAPETTPENAEEVEVEATQETQEQPQEQFEENQEPETQEPETQEPETQEPEKNDEPEEQEPETQEPQKTELETLVETLKGTVDGILSDVAEIKARLDSIDAVLATPVTTPIEETNFTIEENKYDAIAKAMANRK